MLAYLFVVIAVAVRFMPHPWTFTPVVAALLFFGARGSKRTLWFPFAMLVASDIILTKFVYSYHFAWDQLVVWAWYAAIIWLGTALRDRQRPLPVIAAALTSSVSFFVLSNFAVWASSTGLYPKTMQGLISCYAIAVPFFRQALEGDLLFTTVFFATPVVLHFLSGVLDHSGDHSAAA